MLDGAEGRPVQLAMEMICRVARPARGLRTLPMSNPVGAYRWLHLRRRCELGFFARKKWTRMGQKTRVPTER